MERFDGIRSVHYQARDPGLVWTKDPEPCIGPDSPLDSLSILTPNVVGLPEGAYRLYYTGWGRGRSVPDASGYILSAVSDDGPRRGARGRACAWTCTSRTRRYGCSARTSCRCRTAAGECTLSPPADRPTVVKSAVSPDGLAWELEPGVASRLRTRRSVRRGASTSSRRRITPGSAAGYFHSYAHRRRTGLDAPNHIISAIADDGLSVRIEPGVRIAQEDEQRGTLAVYAPEVIRLGEPAEPRYRMYYAAWATAIRGGIFDASSRDGLAWTRSRSAARPGPAAGREHGLRTAYDRP